MKRILSFIIVFAILFPSSVNAFSEWSDPTQIFQGYDILQVSFTPQGKLLFVSNDSIFLANTDETYLEKLFSYSGTRRASMNPVGKIVFDNDFDIFTANSDRSGLKPIANDPDIFEFAISFTPNGKEITFVTIDNINLTYGIWVMELNGSNKRNILSSKENVFRHPRTSPDGSRISYFVTGKGKTPYISVMNANGNGNVNLTSLSGISRQASWSPDGKELVYSSKTDTFDIWIMNSNGTGKRRITFLDGDEAKPVFSPDGNKIAFICSGCQNDGSSLYLVSKKISAPQSPQSEILFLVILILITLLLVTVVIYKK